MKIISASSPINNLRMYALFSTKEIKKHSA